MLVSRGISIISDSQRDAEKYYNLLLALKSATDKISALERGGSASIDEVLASLLPDLTDALGAARAFVAVYRQDKRDRVRGFDVASVHPKMELNTFFIPWSKPLSQVLSDGRARVVEPFEDEPKKPIQGLEVFSATTAILVRMKIGNQLRIVGVCNRVNPEMGPFLVADRKALESIIELITIGLRVGERRRQELENIQKISTAINAELNPDELLPLIAQKAAEVFSAPAVSLMHWDARKENLIIEASYGLSADYVRRQRISRKKVNAAFATSENVHTVVTPDLRKSPFGRVELIKTERLRSALSAQLQVSGELIGILNIYSQDTPRTFNTDELDLAEIFANHAAIAIHNVHMRQRELEGILATSDALKATLDENELLQLIVSKVNSVFGAPVSLILWDDTGKNLVIKASCGLSSNYMTRKIIARDKIFEMDKERKGFNPFIIPDLGLTFYGLQEMCEKEQLFNVLVAPLVSPGAAGAMGFLFIYGEISPRAFTSEEMKIAAMIADQAAIAIRTTQLHGQNKQRGEQLNALQQIALDITGELKINELLASIIERAAGLVQAKGGIVYLWDEKEDEFKPVAAYGNPDLVNIKVDKDRGLIGEILRTKAPLAVPNYYRWSKRQVSLDKYRLTATLGIPILSEERLLGVIAVHDNEEGRLFGKADEELLQRFANHAAVAIENANAYAAEHEAKDYLSRLISSSLDGIIAVDKDGYVTVYNESAERICGYSWNDIQGQKMRVDKLYGDKVMAQDINRRLFKRDKLDNYETFLQAKDGQKIPIALSAILLKDKDGNHKGSVGFFKDLRPLRATLDTITAVTQARDLKEGLNALAEGMVKSLGVTFCQILFLGPNPRSLRVETAYPVSRLQSKPLQWKPEIGKILDLENAPFLENLLKPSRPLVYRRDGMAEGAYLTQYIQRTVGLDNEVESVLVIPLKSGRGALGICILGEVRQWDRNPFTEERIGLARSIADQAAGLIDRLQTYEALRLREGLLKAGKEITSLQELPKILQSIADGVRDALNCDLVTLYTYSEARDEIDLPTISGELDQPNAPYALGYVSKKSIVWKILESREPHFADDSRNDLWMMLDEADRHPGVAPFVLRERIFSSAGIPLIMGSERVGILFANYRSNHPFSEKERNDIQLFATQAAIAINNVRLAKKEEKKRKHLEAVINASKVITASVGLTRQEILERILEQAVETIRVGEELKATLGTIQLLDEKTRELVFECVYPPSILSELKVEIGNRLPVESARNDLGKSGITVRTARTRKPQLVPNVEEDPDYIAYNDTTKSELAVPLLDEDRLIGILDVENDQVHAFDEEDVEALQALADMAVVALNNADRSGKLSFANTVASMGAWGAEIAHDVNRETGAIQRKLYLLQQHFTDLSPEIKKTLEEIERYAESLVLPPFPKQAPKLGEIIEIKNATKLDVTVSSFVEAMKNTYPNVMLIHDLSCAELCVSMPEQWLRRLLRHLIRNAIKSTEGKEIKRVVVRTYVQGDFAKIEIEDTGKGVRPEIIPMLFQQPIRHYSGDERDGQGLLIVRFLVERHGGEIGLAWNHLEEGACFYFTVPILKTDVLQ
jgi:PAS domain S-box-containing protein